MYLYSRSTPAQKANGSKINKINFIDVGILLKFSR